MSPELIGMCLGVVFVVPTVFFLRAKKWDALALPIFLATLPVYYMLFGVLASDATIVFKELLYGLVYIMTGLLLGRVRSSITVVVVALAWISHGFYDYYHDVFFVNPGVFSWYPAFCALVDVVVGTYLLSSLNRLANPIARDVREVESVA